MGSAQWHRTSHRENNSHVHLLCKECIVHRELWLACTLYSNPRKKIFQISLAQVGLIWLLSHPLLPFSPFPCLLWVHAEQPLPVKIIGFVIFPTISILGENHCKFETGVVFFGDQVPKPKPRLMLNCLQLRFDVCVLDRPKKLFFYFPPLQVKKDATWLKNDAQKCSAL